MDHSEKRAVIKYLLKKEMTPKEIQEDMTNTLGSVRVCVCVIDDIC